MARHDSDTSGHSGRWHRREKQRQSERQRLKKHGAGLRRVYLDAIRKRVSARKQG